MSTASRAIKFVGRFARRLLCEGANERFGLGKIDRKIFPVRSQVRAVIIIARKLPLPASAQRSLFPRIAIQPARCRFVMIKKGVGGEDYQVPPGPKSQAKIYIVITDG